MCSIRNKHVHVVCNNISASHMSKAQPIDPAVLRRNCAAFPSLIELGVGASHSDLSDSAIVTSLPGYATNAPLEPRWAML